MSSTIVHKMFSLSSLFLLPFLVLLVSGQDDTKTHPIDALQVKHLLIESYEGPLKYDTLKLFSNVEDLQLKNSTFIPFNSSFLFALSRLKRLKISSNVIEPVDHDITGCCEQLEEAEFIVEGSGDLRKEEMKMIKAMKSLKSLVLRNRRFTILEEDNFLGSNLTDLTIHGCNLRTIKNNAFAKLQQLEKLDLTFNFIMELKKEILAPLKNVKLINLQGNYLEKVTTEQIPPLPNLEILILSDNRLEQFNFEGIKDVAPKLKKVYISGSDLRIAESGGVKIVNYSQGIH